MSSAAPHLPCLKKASACLASSSRGISAKPADRRGWLSANAVKQQAKTIARRLTFAVIPGFSGAQACAGSPSIFAALLFSRRNESSTLKKTTMRKTSKKLATVVRNLEYEETG